jgi:hypothetical protein
MPEVFTGDLRRGFLDVIEANFEEELNEIIWVLFEDGGDSEGKLYKTSKLIFRQRWVRQEGNPMLRLLPQKFGWQQELLLLTKKARLRAQMGLDR